MSRANNLCMFRHIDSGKRRLASATASSWTMNALAPLVMSLPFGRRALCPVGPAYLVAASQLGEPICAKGLPRSLRPISAGKSSIGPTVRQHVGKCKQKYNGNYERRGAAASRAEHEFAAPDWVAATGKGPRRPLTLLSRRGAARGGARAPTLAAGFTSNYLDRGGRWPTSMAVKDLVDLDHDAIGLRNGLDDLLEVLDVLLGQCSTFAVLQPLLTDPDSRRPQTSTRLRRCRRTQWSPWLQIYRRCIDPDGALLPTRSSNLGLLVAEVPALVIQDCWGFDEVQRDELSAQLNQSVTQNVVSDPRQTREVLAQLAPIPLAVGPAVQYRIHPGGKRR